jgi:alkylhydroperoxidase/carboxymuconolactone decarboxylase family protein YurZ
LREQHLPVNQRSEHSPAITTGGTVPNEPRTNAASYSRGVEKYREIYGPDLPLADHGSSDFFDLMIGHLFGEVWTGEALDVPTRRLLVMGVLAAQHEFDTLGIQFSNALRTGELNTEQVREVVVQLIPYVGYPSSGSLFRVSETAIANFEASK